jgi:hypothetical protein
VTYTPVGNYNGADQFTYKVNDGTTDSSAATVSITVTPVNDKPTATAVNTSTSQDVAKAVTLTGHDVEDCNLTFTITANPAHGGLGAISNNSCTAGSPNTDTASITYTPDSGYTGGDSFTYKVTDTGSLDSTDATVTVTVNASGPTTITVPIAFDSHINSGGPNNNYGTLNPLRCREGAGTSSDPIYRPYFQFNVPSLGGTVVSAKLRLFVATASNASTTQTAYTVASNWTESGITYSNAPALGAPGPGSVTASTAGVYVELPIDPTTIASNAANSFAVKGSSSSSAYFNSREAGSNPPQLVIVTQ